MLRIITTMLCMAMYLFGFESIAQVDSIFYLDEVEVLGSTISKYSAGTSFKKMSPSNSGTLDEISNQTAIYFKQYGNGQLSTIALRGTSSSHTNVIWNGLLVNSPTLGQTDFSVWPMFLNKELLVQKGSSSSMFGSGSIGGNVIVENAGIRLDSLLTFYVGIGSFGQKDIGVRSQQRIGKDFISETNVFRGVLKNNFPYEISGTTVRQPNAAVDRLGLSQRFYKKIDNHQLFSEIAYASNDREIQPTITSTSRDQLSTKNLRAVLSDELFIRDKSIYASVGFVKDKTQYNETSETKSTQVSGTISFETPISNSLDSKTGINYILTRSQSENYDGTQQNNQFHVYSSLNFAASRNLRLTLNLREAFHENTSVFVPSMGADLLLWKKEARLSLKGQASSGYRIPTFNDRFWRPGGNPNLNPEKSDNYELGFEWSKPNAFSFSSTAFLSIVSDWIQWQPIDGIWTPRNIRKVKSNGIELGSWVSLYQNGDFVVAWNGDYEFTLTSDQGISQDNQLPYVPKHSFSSGLSTKMNNQGFRIQTNYTGLRFSTLSNSRQSEIDDFLLFDVSAWKSFITAFAAFKINFSMNNALDTSYENLRNTAMPGRNFLLELTINY